MHKCGAVVVILLMCSAVVSAQPADKPVAAQKTGQITADLDFCGPGGMNGVRVYIPGTSFEARPRTSGSFTIFFVPPGTYDLKVEFPEASPYTIPGVVAADNAITNLGAVAICRNQDGDDYYEDMDCNDLNPAIHPEAEEVCDGVDNDCNGLTDEGCDICSDGDGDGFYAQIGCLTVPDCDDDNALISPVAEEACDGIDNNCDLAVDEGFDLTADPSNCGDCGNVCSYPGADAYCIGGACEMGSCLGSYGDCDVDSSNGCEVNLANDYMNCGACGTVCGAEEICVNSVCVAACTFPQANCDGDMTNGCETVLGTTTNCQECGDVCAYAPNSVPDCTSLGCDLICNGGYFNCDQDNLNGCEINLLSDPQNCGQCGNDCPAGWSCEDGECVFW